MLPNAKAHEVHVRLQQTTDNLTVVVEDDGVGLPDDYPLASDGHQGLGIVGMQERADALGVN